jgi:uncharacterized membrane-anchored protein
MKLSYAVFVGLLIALMGVMIWADRFRINAWPQQPAGSNARLPVTDWNYWVVMLAAGVLGTALGDWLADAGLGVYWASLIGVPFFVAALWAAYRFGLSKPWYWVAIATCRTWGTDIGDMLIAIFRSAGAPRPIALWWSTAISAVLLIGIIYFWTKRNEAPEIAADRETSR